MGTRALATPMGIMLLGLCSLYSADTNRWRFAHEKLWYITRKFCVERVVLKKAEEVNITL